ncbi:MAG: two-component sensor histidine kinase [Acetobacteraceae bacterium]|nr:two-component sensor histidine kinase [Acetobacteraceae bacterium]
MALRPIIGGALAALLVPAAALASLVATGALAPAPALAGGLPIALAAFGFAALRNREFGRLAALARSAADGGGPERGGEQPGGRAAEPWSGGATEVARAIERLARVAAAGSDNTGRRRRADEMVVERLPDPVIVLGPDRTALTSNAAARTAYGADIHAVLRHPDLRAAADRACSSRSAQIADLRLPVPVMRDVRATVIPMDGTLGAGGQAVVVLSDRTRERAVERMRADFVANASHELRTPLASLIGFIDTLRGPAASDPEAQERFLGIMAEQAARMNRLIDDLLSLSRVELTEHESPSGRIDLAALLPRIADSFEPQLRERDMTLALDVPNLPPITGDADQIAQVMQNLLDNAIKYGRSGGVVRLSASAEAGDLRLPTRPGVVVRVADDGQGIAREHIPRLTERFYRVDKGRSRSVGGTGLGLAIVRHIVNRHRGQMVIDSTEGAGTIVSVWLPEAPKHGMSAPEQMRGSAASA